jgi:hypothetical protein
MHGDLPVQIQTTIRVFVVGPKENGRRDIERSGEREREER